MTWDTVILGPCVVRNTAEFIEIMGQEQIRLERRDSDLLLTMSLWDETGKQLAKLRENGWAWYQDRFDVVKEPPLLRITERSAGSLVLEAVVGPGTVTIPQAAFLAHDGTLITITKDVLWIGEQDVAGLYLEGGHIRIDRNGLTIG